MGAAVDLTMRFSNTGIPEYIKAGIRAMAGGRINARITNPTDSMEDSNMYRWLELLPEQLVAAFKFSLGPVPVTLGKPRQELSSLIFFYSSEVILLI